MWHIKNPYFIKGNPNNWRTWLRTHLPQFLGRRIAKGINCEQLGSIHFLYHSHDNVEACYHCNCEFYPETKEIKEVNRYS
ncbi:MAG: hypothetical protein HWE13_15955 [Gammaproteobacteria bacterium]|nr:hypothetical protein [Gammaproteobacteria bacterium]